MQLEKSEREIPQAVYDAVKTIDSYCASQDCQDSCAFRDPDTGLCVFTHPAETWYSKLRHHDIYTVMH